MQFLITPQAAVELLDQYETYKQWRVEQVHDPEEEERVKNAFERDAVRHAYRSLGHIAQLVPIDQPVDAIEIYQQLYIDEGKPAFNGALAHDMLQGIVEVCRLHQLTIT